MPQKRQVSGALRSIRPDDAKRYAAMLEQDRALQAFASLARLARAGRTAR